MGFTGPGRQAAALCIIATLLASVVAEHNRAAWHVTVQRKGLNKAKGVFLPASLGAMRRLVVPDIIKDDDDAAFSYSFTNVQIKDFIQDPEDTYCLFDDARQEFVMGSKAAEMVVKATFWVKSNRLGLTTSGDIVVTLSGGHIHVGVGYPLLDTGESGCSIGTPTTVRFATIDFTIENSWMKWLYEGMGFILQDAFRTAAEKVLADRMDFLVMLRCTLIMNAFPWPGMSASIGLTFDWRITQPIHFWGGEHADFHFRGEVYNTNDHKEAPADRHVLPANLHFLDRDYVMYFDEYIFNSALYTLHDLGLLKKTLSDADIPDSSPVRLNTKAWQDVIPAVYEKYPDAQMGMHASVSHTPQVSITPNGINILVTGDLAMFVLGDKETGAEDSPLFTLSLTIAVHAPELVFDDVEIPNTVRLRIGTINIRSITISDVSPELGDVPRGTSFALQSALNLAANSFGVQFANGITHDKGVKILDVATTKYVDNRVKLIDGFVVVGGTLLFQRND